MGVAALIIYRHVLMHTCQKKNTFSSLSLNVAPPLLPHVQDLIQKSQKKRICPNLDVLIVCARALCVHARACAVFSF